MNSPADVVLGTVAARSTGIYVASSCSPQADATAHLVNVTGCANCPDPVRAGGARRHDRSAPIRAGQ
jgi:hypothetical protein